MKSGNIILVGNYMGFSLEKEIKESLKISETTARRNRNLNKLTDGK
jgi:hypothetical protein